MWHFSIKTLLHWKRYTSSMLKSQTSGNLSPWLTQGQTVPVLYVLKSWNFCCTRLKTYPNTVLQHVHHIFLNLSDLLTQLRLLLGFLSLIWVVYCICMKVKRSIKKKFLLLFWKILYKYLLFMLCRVVFKSCQSPFKF